MSNRLLLKSSGTADAVPDFSDLELAELVVNTRSGKMFCKTYDGATYAIVDLSLSSPDEIIASGQGLIGQPASGGGPCALLSGADAVALLPAATASGDGKATAAQITLLNALNSREIIGVVTDDWSPTLDTTYDDIPGLSFAGVQIDTWYTVDAYLSVNLAAGADFKLKLALENQAQKLSVTVEYSNGVNFTLSPTSLEAIYDFTSSQTLHVRMFGTIKTHATTSGYVKLQMAERVNGTAPVVYVGACMSLKRVVV